MRQKAPHEVADLMSISEDLAALNVQRYRSFTTPFTKKNARPSVLAFAGDVYMGMDVRNRFGRCNRISYAVVSAQPGTVGWSRASTTSR